MVTSFSGLFAKTVWWTTKSKKIDNSIKTAFIGGFLSHMTTRTEIIENARTWLGTRFHHQGRVKATLTHKGGCDCIGLVVGVVKELGMESEFADTITGSKRLLHEFDYRNYSKLPDGKLLRSLLKKYLKEIPVAEIQIGDVLLFRFENDPQHVAIVSDYVHGGTGIIHCYAASRKVVEHRLDDTWKKRIVSAFSFHNISN